jgi:hypothetical protein
MKNHRNSIFSEQAYQGYQDFRSVREQSTKFGHLGLRDGRIRRLPGTGRQPQVINKHWDRVPWS